MQVNTPIGQLEVSIEADQDAAIRATARGHSGYEVSGEAIHAKSFDVVVSKDDPTRIYITDIVGPTEAFPPGNYLGVFVVEPQRTELNRWVATHGGGLWAQ